MAKSTQKKIIIGWIIKGDDSEQRKVKITSRNMLASNISLNDKIVISQESLAKTRKINHAKERELKKIFGI